MKRLFVLFVILSQIYGCEKADQFGSLSSDKLIYPDVNLIPARWTVLNPLSDNSYSDLSFCNDKTGMVSGFAGTVYITKTGGDTWKTINTNANMTFLAIYSLNENTYFTARKGLYKSTDSGSTWKLCKFSTEVSIFEIWFKDANVGFLSSGSGTYRTTDAGETWEKVSGEVAKNLQFTSDNIGYFTFGSTAVTKGDINSLSSGDICRSSDGGKTWKKMGLDVTEISCLSFISDRTGFFATNDYSLYKTSDGGETCNLIGKKDFIPSDLFFVNENQGYVCTGKGISITLDGGNTFTAEYTNQGYGMIYDFEFPSPGIGYAIGNAGLLIKRIEKK